jgi:hypothetical protein
MKKDRSEHNSARRRNVDCGFAASASFDFRRRRFFGDAFSAAASNAATFAAEAASHLRSAFARVSSPRMTSSGPDVIITRLCAKLMPPKRQSSGSSDGKSMLTASTAHQRDRRASQRRAFARALQGAEGKGGRTRIDHPRVRFRVLHPAARSSKTEASEHLVQGDEHLDLDAHRLDELDDLHGPPGEPHSKLHHPLPHGRLRRRTRDVLTGDAPEGHVESGALEARCHRATLIERALHVIHRLPPVLQHDEGADDKRSERTTQLDGDGRRRITRVSARAAAIGRLEVARRADCARSVQANAHVSSHARRIGERVTKDCMRSSRRHRPAQNGPEYPVAHCPVPP